MGNINCCCSDEEKTLRKYNKYLATEKRKYIREYDKLYVSVFNNSIIEPTWKNKMISKIN